MRKLKLWIPVLHRCIPKLVSYVWYYLVLQCLRQTEAISNRTSLLSQAAIASHLLQWPSQKQKASGTYFSFSTLQKLSCGTMQICPFWRVGTGDCNSYICCSASILKNLKNFLFHWILYIKYKKMYIIYIIVHYIYKYICKSSNMIYSCQILLKVNLSRIFTLCSFDHHLRLEMYILLSKKKNP